MAIEDAMARICQKHDRLRLNMMVRAAIAPQMFFGKADFPSIRARPLRIISIAALKHGGTIANQETAAPQNGISPELPYWTRLDIEHLLELSIRYDRFCSLIKAFGSGAQIRVDEYTVHFEMNGELDQLSIMENQRLENNKLNILSPLGSIAFMQDGLSSLKDEHFGADGSPIMIGLYSHDPDLPPVNLSRQTYMPKYHGQALLTMNYTFILHQTQDFEQLARLDTEFFEQLYGVTIDEFLLCLRGLTENQLRGMMAYTERVQCYCLTGLGFHDRKLLIQWLGEWLRSHGNDHVSEPEDLADRFFTSFLLLPDDYTATNLHDAMLESFLISNEPYVLVDWTFVPTFIFRVLSRICSRQEMANIKGQHYEEGLYDWLNQKLDTLVTFLPPNQNLKIKGNEVGEVDLALLDETGSIGFVIDCKAYNVSLGLLRGDEAAVNTRWGYTEKWLAQVIKTTRFLASNPIGDNYEMPGHIKQLVPIVCSSHVEPVFDFDDRHMLTQKQPRVCTPFELLGILQHSDKMLLDANEYTFRVKTSL